MEIVLIRHGKPEYELTGKARAREFHKIVRDYNRSGIVEDPPQKTKLKALESHVAVCSDLTRSIKSAQALGFKEIHLCDPIFREVAIPYFTSGSLTMSVTTWIILLRILSIFGFSKNGESLSMAKQRAKIAASKLIEIAQTHEKVLLVGHGFTNYFIAKELLARNWRGPGKPGGGYWEYGVYACNLILR
ncbi:histidine phosphatase family protein [Kaarinaea lacus]